MSTTAIGAPATTAAGSKVWLVLCSITSVQLGAGFAGRLFDDAGPAAVVMLRQGLSAAVLLAVARPSLRRPAAEWKVILAFGTVLAGMNLTFYEAVARLPLGVAVTIELLGPLVLAVALSRRAGELWWAGVAVAGALLLGRGGTALDPVGVAFACAAAAGWAGYILLSRAAGQRSSGIDGLALAMATACVVAAPLGAGGLHAHASDARVLGLGALVALLSGLVPFTCELVALRHIAPRVFGVLMSLSPVAAAASGAILLGERLTVTQLVAMGMVVVASAATVRTA